MCYAAPACGVRGSSGLRRSSSPPCLRSRPRCGPPRPARTPGASTTRRRPRSAWALRGGGGEYEAAFSLRPDPALLYNAAQSYRLAGNKARALELYRNDVRLDPDGTNAEDARSHVAALKKASEDERPPSAPPVAPAPARAPSAPPPVRVGAVRASAGDDAAARRDADARRRASAVSAAARGRHERADGVQSAPAGDAAETAHAADLVWVALGAAAVLVGTTVYPAATRGDTFPDATLGQARGNSARRRRASAQPPPPSS